METVTLVMLYFPELTMVKKVPAKEVKLEPHRYYQKNTEAFKSLSRLLLYSLSRPN